MQYGAPARLAEACEAAGAGAGAAAHQMPQSHCRRSWPPLTGTEP